MNTMNGQTFKFNYENKIQKPRGLKKFIYYLFILIDIFLILFSVLGFSMKETEMGLVFGGLALFLLAIIIFLRHAYNTSYQETDEDFILKVQNKQYHVQYKDIVDWKPAFNEITILDQTTSDKTYIKVNIKFFKPEILLRRIVEMAFAGKFMTSNPVYLGDINRKMESVNYLVLNRYGYLVEDYIEKVQYDTQIND